MNSDPGLPLIGPGSAHAGDRPDRKKDMESTTIAPVQLSLTDLFPEFAASLPAQVIPFPTPPEKDAEAA